jgi:hypothetical protein
MPKRKRPEEDPKKQFERFAKAAREHGVSEEEAARRFEKIAKPKSASRSSQKTDK